MYKPTPYFLGAIAALIVFGCLFSTASHSDDLVRFNHPTQYVAVAPATVGEPLAAGDIQHTVLRIFDSATDTTVNATILIERAATDDPLLPPPTQLTVARAAPVSGSTTQCYDLATVMKVSAGGEQSTFTDKVCKTVTAPPRKPKRPSNGSVQ